jgi:hypothetical protein
MAEIFRILQGSRDVDCCMKARFAITGALMWKVRRKFITGRLLERSSRILCGIFEAGVLQAVTQVFRCGAFVHSVQNKLPCFLCWEALARYRSMGMPGGEGEKPSFYPAVRGWLDGSVCAGGEGESLRFTPRCGDGSTAACVPEVKGKAIL